MADVFTINVFVAFMADARSDNLFRSCIPATIDRLFPARACRFSPCRRRHPRRCRQEYAYLSRRNSHPPADEPAEHVLTTPGSHPLESGCRRGHFTKEKNHCPPFGGFDNSDTIVTPFCFRFAPLIACSHVGAEVKVGPSRFRGPARAAAVDWTRRSRSRRRRDAATDLHARAGASTPRTADPLGRRVGKIAPTSGT